ncbi:hypothetical protein SLS60_004468 [Paraconiothyrium brasiliense]|uniref:ABC transporter domain-containing protein n=1 Tax=Paraconiothyrium brasiliense TaxID=300254 RepID=A0ABR3RKL9_9PLEO
MYVVGKFYLRTSRQLRLLDLETKSPLLETSLGAIARLKTFNETVRPEDKDEHEDVIPSEQWPRTGAVEIKGVSAAYDADEESPNLALRNINLKIESGEKIAICGRTGSGKSSLVALLLKLLDPLPSDTQEVIIDDTPLSRINRASLRQCLIAVPQEAVFLPDGTTFQSNLDPYEASTPEDCKAVLIAIGLWTFVEERGGLNAGMTAGTFSAGQRQLFSVGRALLRRRIRASSLDGATDQGILLLDEVSSSVDRQTEIVMQEIIEREFTNYTVIAVSHRLDMIMGFDRVIVMDKGDIVEMGKPVELSTTRGSKFGDLVRAGNKRRGEQA